MASQKTERTVAVVLGGLSILAGISGVVYKFSNLETRVDFLEKHIVTLTPAKGSRGDLCGQIMTSHLQAVMKGEGNKAAVLSKELDRFQCTDFDAAYELTEPPKVSD